MPRRPEFDREELIDRACDLFWKQGWAGTSMKDLEGALRLKPGSFYAAFGSKAALFALTLDKYAAAGAKRLGALAAEHGAFAALQRYPALLVSGDDAPAKACMLAKTVLELSNQDPQLAAQANAHLSNIEKRFADLFRAAQAAGDIAENHDPEVLARRYQSDLLGLRVSAERDGVNATAIAQEIAEGLTQLATG